MMTLFRAQKFYLQIFFLLIGCKEEKANKEKRVIGAKIGFLFTYTFPNVFFLPLLYYLDLTYLKEKVSFNLLLVGFVY